jgi:hypothetical protein
MVSVRRLIPVLLIAVLAGVLLPGQTDAYTHTKKTTLTVSGVTLTGYVNIGVIEPYLDFYSGYATSQASRSLDRLYARTRGQEYCRYTYYPGWDWAAWSSYPTTWWTQTGGAYTHWKDGCGLDFRLKSIGDCKWRNSNPSISKDWSWTEVWPTR